MNNQPFQGSDQGTKGTGKTRPPLPDLEKMKRYQAELEADATTPTLTEQERRERIAFLMGGVICFQQAFPAERLASLADGLERLLADLYARRQLSSSQQASPDGHTPSEKQRPG